MYPVGPHGGKMPDPVIIHKNRYVYRRLPENAKYRLQSPTMSANTLTKVYDKSGVVIPKTPKKVLVFDLDETIGYFTDLHIIWNSVFYSEHTLNYPTENELDGVFAQIFNVYPEFLRYGMISILIFLRRKITSGETGPIFLYTNNQCRYPEWVRLLLHYIEKKVAGNTTMGDIEHSMFAKPVCAFKINNRVIETLRTTTTKTYSDFISCTKLPKTTEICFVDDTYYKNMDKSSVYYIQPPSYYHGLSHAEIESRFYTHIQPVLYREKYISASYIFPRLSFPYPDPIIRPYKHPYNEHVYHRILYYIKEFFIMTVSSIHTRRVRVHIGRFSRKLRTIHPASFNDESPK